MGTWYLVRTTYLSQLGTAKRTNEPQNGGILGRGSRWSVPWRYLYASYKQRYRDQR